MKLTRPNLNRYTQSQRRAIFLLLALIIGVEIFGYIIMNNGEEAESISIPSEVIALQSEIDKSENLTSNYPLNEIKKFDPNELNSKQWQELGFSPKQVQTIFKYKKSLGGKFSSKEQIRNCYVISTEKFTELEKYIVFSSRNFKEPEFEKTSESKEKKPKINYRKFNPNDYSQADWKNIGFSTKQAQTILKYKRSLGGKFSTLAEIKKCYVITEEKFEEMKPFMILKFEKGNIEEENSSPNSIGRANIEKFNPNTLTREDWGNLGFSEKQINTIFNYKNSLGGKFKDAETLRKCYSISEEKFKEIEPYLDFDMN